MQLSTTKLATAVVAAVALLLIAPAFVGHNAYANNKARKKIEKKAREAMENYDLLEYEEAKKLLNEAIVLAKKNDMADDKSMAKVHLNLGIVYFAGLQDVEAAKLQFIDAVQIDSGIEIGAAYKTKEMEALLVEAKQEYGSSGGGGGGGGGGGSTAATIDCGSLMGIAHTLVDTAEEGSDKKIEAAVSGELKAKKVSLLYRAQGEADFSEAKMEKEGGCTYVGTIPGSALRGEFLHYYVAAYNSKGKVVASKGSAGSPNVIEITPAVGEVGSGGAGGMGSDVENPLTEGGGGKPKRHVKSNDSGGSISKGVPGPSGPKRAKLFLSIAAGTGGGYVSGDTEQRRNEVGCCVAPALLHLFPELGYYVSPTTSISAAFRMGFPIGANIQGHATGAPSGLLRVRHALDPSGDGLLLSGGVGAGVIRHTVQLSGTEPAEVDTSASGPLLVSGGAGYSKSMGGPIKFIAELNAIAAVPVIEETGTCPGEGCVRYDVAFHVDFNLALLFAF